MTDILLIIVIVLGALPFVAVATRRLPGQLRRFVWYGFGVRIAFIFVMIVLLVWVYGGGDIMIYRREALPLSHALRTNFFDVAPELLYAILGERQPSVWMSGSTTGAMVAFAAVVLFATFDSLYATCFLIGMWAFSGQIALLFAARGELPPQLHRRAAMAILFIPSVVLWSSALLKEGPVMGAMGWLILGTHWFVTGKRRVLGLILVATMAGAIGTMKPYVLFPYAIAGPLWFIWHRWSGTERALALIVRPFYLTVAVVLAVAGLLGLGLLFPRFAAENLVTEAARMQGLYQERAAGSTYNVVTPQNTSIAGQLALAPLGMISSLLRPFFFEVHNVASAMNTLEMTAILGLWIQIARRRKLRSLLQSIFRSPFLVFCLAYILPFAIGIGIAAPNLGSLSRYRIPMMPLYICLLLSLMPWTRWERRSQIA